MRGAGHPAYETRIFGPHQIRVLGRLVVILRATALPRGRGGDGFGNHLWRSVKMRARPTPKGGAPDSRRYRIARTASALGKIRTRSANPFVRRNRVRRRGGRSCRGRAKVGRRSQARAASTGGRACGPSSCEAMARSRSGARAVGRPVPMQFLTYTDGDSCCRPGQADHQVDVEVESCRGPRSCNVGTCSPRKRRPNQPPASSLRSSSRS